MSIPESQVAVYSPAAALKSLAADDVKFLRSLPKAELHAHLNGSIPIDTLLCLLEKYSPDISETPSDAEAQPVISREEIAKTLKAIRYGVSLNETSNFFSLFKAIYALTSTPQALRIATQAVLQSFLECDDDNESPQCTYLELRTTPRKTLHMTRAEYLQIVLEEINKYPKKAALIVCLDRRMSKEDLDECVGLAIRFKKCGVVAIDVCGDPGKGDIHIFTEYIKRAQDAGLRLTVHIAETTENTRKESRTILSWRPDRLGHATFLPDDLKAQFFVDAPGNEMYQPCIELCLSSNLIGKSVTSLTEHHIHYYLKHHHPIAICTDDVLVFRTSCVEEYALLLAKPPLGLGLDKEAVAQVAQMSMDAVADSSIHGMDE